MGRDSFTKKGTKDWFGDPYQMTINGKKRWAVVYHKWTGRGYTNFVYVYRWTV